MKTKFYKNVAWLEPFFHLAKGLVPINKVIMVRGFRIPYNKCEIVDANCIRDNQNKTFTITIRTHNQILESNGNGTFFVRSYKRRMVVDMLSDFAHELAHLKKWFHPYDHSPEHWILEMKIARRFAKELQRRGIQDVTLRKVLGNTDAEEE